MKIGIDISQIVYKGTGVARFTDGLVKAILKYDRKNEWVFFFSGLRQKLDPALVKKIQKKGFKVIKWYLPPTLLSFLWNNLHGVSRIINSQFSTFNSFDWFITSDWTEPPLKSKKATIVHDLVYLRYPETVDEKILKTQEKRLHWVKHESQLIFADSDATYDDLNSLLNIPIKRLKTIYPGVEITKPTKTEIATTLKKYNLKKPFILTVGKIEPRKNIQSLIEAFQKIRNPEAELIVVGQEGWGAVNKKSDNVRFLGYITDNELAALYASCLFFICPSIWEGFGYPVVEAMKLGAAVACSNTSSLKELGQGAAYLFDPAQPQQILKALDVLLNDEQLRSKLSKEGPKKGKEFDWKNYYDKFIKTLYDNRD